jgi:DNA-binding CsgD family transcriptional regulator
MSASENNTSELSERERQILRLVATGASNKEIAQQLSISPNTVKVHLRNIFAKIGVASRTEATLYAIRNGFAQLSSANNNQTATSLAEIENTSPIEAATPSLPSYSAPRFNPLSQQLRTSSIVALLLILIVVIAIQWRSTNTLSSPTPTPPSRWQPEPDMPTARSKLATTVYENQIYAIGGQTSIEVTNIVERYNPTTKAWDTLASKQVAAADIKAAVIGGRIFVPGGRLASGKITNVLEVYDPRIDRWSKSLAMPVALSAYALAAFEGKLYVFGGWDGERYRAEVYQYDPELDTWLKRTSMPTARGFIGATVAGEKIYVIGGTTGKQILATNEEYTPDAESRGATPWQERAPLPAGRSGMGVATAADVIYIIGGETTDKNITLQYFPRLNQWQPIESPFNNPWSHLGLVSTEAFLYAIGGQSSEITLTHNFSYQVLYMISLPIVH